MTLPVRQLAEWVHGQVHGDADLLIQAARPLGDAGPGDVTFVENSKHARKFHDGPASAAVVRSDFPTEGRTCIVVADPLTAFVTIFRRLHGRPPPTPWGIDPRAVVHATAHLGDDTSVHPFAVVGEGSVLGARCTLHAGVVVGRCCRLGDDVTLYPHAVLYDGTVLGNRVIVHAHAVLGADGFGYRFQGGRHVKVPQLGHVEIGDDVEIGACSAIDRGTFQATRVGAGSKLDNLVQVGHNCRLGHHNILVSQVGVGGSSSTGDHVVLAGQAGVSDHITIGDGVQVGPKGGVTRDIPAGQRVWSMPATRHGFQIMACLERLPELRREVLDLKRQLAARDKELSKREDKESKEREVA